MPALLVTAMCARLALLLALTLHLAQEPGAQSNAFPQDIAPLNVVTSQDARSYPAFRGLASDNDSAPPGLDFQRLLRVNQTLYITARDHIYSFDLGVSPQGDLTPRRRAVWKTRLNDMQNCAMRGKHHDECHNFIRVLVPRNDRTLFACGTNAFNPVCRNYKMESLIQEGEELNGQARCPFDTRQTNAALFADGNLYSATVADFLASDAVIYRSLGENPVLRSVKYDSKWLKEPHFVHAIEHGHYIYFFFREISIEYTAVGRVVFSRVGRVCKNDMGGSPRVLEKYWTSFLKARLNCSISGDSFFYFDSLRSLSDVVPVNGRPAVIGIFTTQTNSIPGSAVCAYYMDDIQSVFDGPFKEQRSTDSSWSPVPPDRVPKPRPGCCAGQGEAEAYKTSNEFPDESLSFIKSHPLLDQSVSPIMEQPMLTRTVGRSKLSQIVADTAAGPYQNYTVLFVSTEDGTILKVLPRIHPDSPTESLLLEEMDVYNPGKCSVKGEDKRILGLELDKDHHALFVGFPGCVIRVPLSRCQSYGKCKRACIGARDPYCGWLRAGRCATLHPGTRSGFEQDVEYSRIQHLEQCEDTPPSIRDSLQDPSNGVRKEAGIPNSSGDIHINFLIACTVSAFVFGAFVSGLAFSWYCSRALDRARRTGKEAEGALAHTVSLPTLAKLSGLLEGQGKGSQAEGTAPQLYASLLVNCRSRASPAGYPELSALPTPDSTPELPPKNLKPFRGQWERGLGGGPGAKDFDGRPRASTGPTPHPCGPQPFHIPSAVVLPNNAHGRELALPSPSEGPEEKKARGPEVGDPPAPQLPAKVVDISTLDELLRHLQEMSAHSRATLASPRGAPPLPSTPRPVRVPDHEDAAYYASVTLPRDGPSRPRPQAPPSPPLPERQGPPLPPPHQHPPQRHSLSTTFPKTNPTAPGGLAKHHSFNQARGQPLLPLPPDPSGAPRGLPARHSGTIPRHGSHRGPRPDISPKPAASPTPASSSPSEERNH